jgi:hypothetical protein
MWMSRRRRARRLGEDRSAAQKVLRAATLGGVNVIERIGGGGVPLPTSASAPGQLMNHGCEGARPSPP